MTQVDNGGPRYLITSDANLSPDEAHRISARTHDWIDGREALLILGAGSHLWERDDIGWTHVCHPPADPTDLAAYQKLRDRSLIAYAMGEGPHPDE